MRFSKIAGALVTFLSLSLVVSWGSGAMAASTSSSPDTSALETAATAFLNQEAAARHWTLTSDTITQTSLSTTATTVTVQYLVTQTHLLDYASPDDVPIMKGFEAGLAQVPSLTSAKRQSLQGFIALWRSNLQSYITTPTLSHEGLKVTATLSSGGSVVPSSIQVFELADEAGDWDSASTVLAKQMTPSAQQAKGQQGLVQMAATLPNSTTFTNYFDFTAALSYARAHTGNCQEYGTCYTDPSCNEGITSDNYNTSTFPCVPECNDCADFVSQIMYAGGINTSSSWYASSSSSCSNAPADWYQVTSLVNYMLANQNTAGWIDSSQQLVPAGGVVEESNGQHVELVDYNDGGSGMLFDSHTSDRLAYPYGGGGPWPGAENWYVPVIQ